MLFNPSRSLAAISLNSRGEITGESVTNAVATKVIPPAVDTSFQLLPSNPNRRKLVIRNETGASVYVAFGTAATWGTASVELKNYESRELAAPVWQGSVHAVQGGSSVTGFVIVTEFTD